MNYKKILFVFGVILSIEPLQAFSGPAILRLVVKASQATKNQYFKGKDAVTAATKKFQDKFKVNDVQSVRSKEFTSHGQGTDSRVMQAARTDAELNTTATGCFNFPKTSTTTTNHTVHNHHYGSKGWGESFFGWLQNGGQSRAAATGVAVGGLSGYGLCATTTKPEEKSTNAGPYMSASPSDPLCVADGSVLYKELYLEIV